MFDSRTVIRADALVDVAFTRLRSNAAANRFFYTATELGNHSIIWHALNGIQLARTRDVRRAAGIATALGIESALVNGPVKMLFRRARPVPESARPHRLRVPKTSSFPSGHATSALCAAALLGANDPERRPLYYLIGGLVAVSRIHVRIHHASDVAAGALFGAAFGAIAKRLVFRSR